MTKLDKFTLTQSIAGEFELDRGPKPSGYAQLTLRFYPGGSGNHAKPFTISLQSEHIWKLRTAKAQSDNHNAKVKQQIELFMPTILNGIREGVADALANCLEKPLVDIEVLVTGVTIDPVYSTEKAFYFAAKSLTAQALTEASAHHFIRTVQGETTPVPY